VWQEKVFQPQQISGKIMRTDENSEIREFQKQNRASLVEIEAMG
jgi:hypothetical protein